MPSGARQDEFDPIEFNDFEEELKRLSAANDELLAELHADEEEDLSITHPTHDLLSDGEALAMLRGENAELKASIRKLEASAHAEASQGGDVWVERQREYEMLLEEKSEVIRALHQKMHDLQEIPSQRESAPSSGGVRQAEEILGLKREMEDQRLRLEQDEEEMMDQMRKMEMTMARERAEMARQRQEMSRLQADLAHEIEHNSRDSGLKERLQNLRRPQGGGSQANLQAPPSVRPEPVDAPPQSHGKDSSGFFRRMFG